ncbi:MAG: DMT family transporter [Silicimonas sp.]|nr:DMT family transporter [Silicimonas sp.]
MQVVFYMLAAAVVGSMISIQPPLNAILARGIGSAYGATAISIGIAFLCILIFVSFMGGGEINTSTLSTVPWWVIFAGIVGAIFVGAGVVIAPVTGALVFFVCIVAGQLIGSTIIDHLGAFGLAVREVSAGRLAGIALVIIGAVMVGRG